MNDVVSKMVAKVQVLWITRQRGATAVEYAMLVAFVATVLIAVVTTMGLTVANTFVPVSDNLP